MSYEEGQERCGLKVGDEVTVVSTAVSKEQGWKATWVDSMNHTIGEVGHIAETGMCGLRVDLESGAKWWYPYFSLAKGRIRLTKEEKEYLKYQANNMFSPGELVEITSAPADGEKGWPGGWESSMDASVGKTYTVLSTGVWGVMLSNGYYYPYFVLKYFTLGGVAKIGDWVMLVENNNPEYGMGDRKKGDIGKVVSVNDKNVELNFGDCSGWTIRAHRVKILDINPKGYIVRVKNKYYDVPELPAWDKSITSLVSNKFSYDCLVRNMESVPLTHLILSYASSGLLKPLIEGGIITEVEVPE